MTANSANPLYRQLYDDLHKDKSNVERLGHSWDVADVLAVIWPHVEKLQRELNCSETAISIVERIPNAIEFQAQITKLELQNKKYEEALKFYADPDTYFDIAILSDPPCGEFVNDYSEHGIYPDYPHGDVRPGKIAREALGWPATITSS